MSLLFIQGPSGSGKSTLSRALAKRLGWYHLDRDDISGERPLVYKKLRERLGELIAMGQDVIIDAPFLYEGDEDFSAWLGDIDESFLVVSLRTPGEERKRRRQSRGLKRDRVENWQDVLNNQEAHYQPLSGSLVLSGELQPHVLQDIVVWNLGEEGRSIRKARPDDLEALWDLKKEVLESSFSQFLYEDELSEEIKQVASRQAVDKLLKDNLVFLAEKRGEPWALVALSPLEEDEEGKIFSKIFSGYSRGDHAAVAIGAKIVSTKADLDYLLACVYRDNEQSKHVLRSFGFQPQGESHTNRLVPRIPIEHWTLEL